MNNYLYKIANKFVSEYGDDLTNFCFVFPSRRATVFFRKYIGLCNKKPIFSPTLITVSDLFLKLSKIELGDRIELLYILYQKYNSLCPKYDLQSDSFDDFVSWGEMILSDFNDVDKYNVDASALFSNIEDLKRIETDYSFLTEDQISVIKRFWKVLNTDVEKNDNKRLFRNTWMLLRDLYSIYKDELLSRGMAYEGLIFRNIAEQIKSNPEEILEKIKVYKKILFIGQNAISETEKILYDFIRFLWSYAY